MKDSMMLGLRSISTGRWKDATPFLFYCVFLFAWGGILFGLDTGSFGSVQALPSWLNVFGSKTAHGQYKLTTTRQAIMNGIVWPGKLLGTMIFEPLAKRYGYRATILVTCVLQFIGIIVEVTAHEWIQFSVGRIISYIAVGLVENTVPSYSAEIAPITLRGLFSGSLMCIVTLGNIWGAGMGKATSEYTTNAGWLIPVAIQFIPAGILLAGLPFTVESPRWLLVQGKHDAAKQCLDRLRPSRLVSDGSTGAELDGIVNALEADTASADGTWFELFQGTYLRRTIIASLLFWFQQTTGSQLVLAYGPTFFKDMGLGSNSFTYSLVAQIAGFVGALIACLVTDRIGRRPLLISGMFLAALFNFLIAGLGSKANPSSTETGMVIAALVLLSTSIKYSATTLAYLIAAEIGGTRMRKKTIAFATAIDVLAAVTITIALPYLLGNPGADLKAGVGWVLGGNSILALLFAIMFVPELKGRSLEEVDELFKANLWAWQFKDYETSSAMAQPFSRAEKCIESKVLVTHEEG